MIKSFESKLEKISKKHLTSESGCARIAKPNGESAGPEQKALKEIEKDFKKVLDKQE